MSSRPRGCGAATASIAKEAGVSNGSLFLYFDTKAVLLNELYVALKAEMAAAAVEGLPAEGDPGSSSSTCGTSGCAGRSRLPEKQRALARLEVAEDITVESRRTVSSALSGIADLLERSRIDGPMRDAPLGFVVTLTSAIADATIDAMIREPDQAEAHGRTAFDAIWRMLA